MDLKAVGQRIKSAREAKNLTQDAYCEAKRPDLRSKTVAFRF